MHDGQIKLGVCDEKITFNVFESMNQPKDEESCSWVDVLEEVVVDTRKKLHISCPFEKVLIDALEALNDEDEKVIEECMPSLDVLK